MEIEYKGANCVVITTKKTRVVIDPKLSLVGLKDYSTKDAVQVVTAADYLVESKDQHLAVSIPGEYEVADVSVKGIAAMRHTDSSGKNSTKYRIDAAQMSIGVIGHVAPSLSDAQLEALGVIDILIVPVGGRGYTLDSHGAAALVRRIGPKVVIPTHYAEPGLEYEVPQEEVASFISEMSVPHEVMAKYKIKNSSVLPATLTIVQLEKTT